MVPSWTNLSQFPDFIFMREFCLWLPHHFPLTRTNALQYEVINDINITVKIMRESRKTDTHTQRSYLYLGLCVHSMILPLTAQMQIVKITIIIITRLPSLNPSYKGWMECRCQRKGGWRRVTDGVKYLPRNLVHLPRPSINLPKITSDEER